ncbi:MAG: dTMP kinase [Bacillota bacterium]|nr:dTMP kinase [Bacillota bacterium]
MFITVEGIDGSGKSTQLRLLAEWLQGLGREIVITREPGGTLLGEEIRRLLLTAGPESIVPQAEFLLYAAARAQLVAQVIRPALARGALVLSDRFSDSTLAYQVAGRGLKKGWVEEVLLGATGGLRPDLTFLFDISPQEARARKGAADRLEKEGLEFFRLVREGYLALAHQEPERIVVLRGDLPPAEVQAEVRRYVAERLGIA